MNIGERLIKFEPLLFCAILALLLVPIWATDFFVTVDGPCHLHNSKILLDWLDETKRTFYEPFYYLNTNFDPNWLYNLMTFPILRFLGPAWTEKIFFTIYILGFGFGFRFLISEINPKAKFISSIGLLFCYHKLLATGFLNNSLSFVIWFWVAGWWWRKRDESSPGLLIFNACLFLLLYSAHPIGLTFGMMMIISMIFGLLMFESQTDGLKLSSARFYRRLKVLFISALPALVLFTEYIFRSNLVEDKSVHHLSNTFVNIGKAAFLKMMDSSEEKFALATSVICILLFLGGLVLRIRQKGLLSTDGLIFFMGLVMAIIIYPPNSISGGLEVSFRIAIIPFVGLLCWTATANFPIWAQSLGQLMALILCIGFTLVRLPVYREASDYAGEIYSCDPYIKNNSTLFVLNYDWNGQTPDGNKIADGLWLFTHVDCYLGVNKSLIISDNYEAHFPYFPIKVLWNTDMNMLTDKDGINFNNRPPRADILSYYTRTKQNIDYVLMISYREEFYDNSYTREIFDQLDQAYDKIFVSKYSRAILYRRKDL